MNSNQMTKSLNIGWSQTDITPEQPVYLCGQHYARISEGVMDPVTATVLAIVSSGPGQDDDCAIMVSCDLAGVSDELRDAVRARISSRLGAIEPAKILFNATHTHAAPHFRIKPRYAPESVAQEEDPTAPYGISLDAMSPVTYVEWAAQRIADAIIEAWTSREPAGIGYGIGHAVVARNRRLTYRDGTSKMYGDPGSAEFSHVEGVEDHAIQVMATYGQNRGLTGIVVNVPCPSQVSEHAFQISADYWHETRQELRARFGEQIHILPQCGPAGDLSPHVLVGKRAEARMWRLKGRETEQNAPRTEIARKIAEAVSDILPYAELEIDWHPSFCHKIEVLPLPRRKLSVKDVEEAQAEADKLREEYNSWLSTIEKNPGIRNQKRWYQAVTRPYVKMRWNNNVAKRFEWQKQHPEIPMELHAIRIGDIAMATNPFELYLDYAVRMRELSKATQTFLVQLAGAGSYLPSQRTIAHKGYGSVPASTDIGPDGGEKLVDWTVNCLNQMF